MVARAKKNKKKPDKSTYDIIRVCNYLHISAMVRTLSTVYGWDKEQLSEFIESHMALLGEVADHRNGIGNFVSETEGMTGINITELIDQTYK